MSSAITAGATERRDDLSARADHVACARRPGPRLLVALGRPDAGLPDAIRRQSTPAGIVVLVVTKPATLTGRPARGPFFMPGGYPACDRTRRPT
jgi:hypothetical protein